MRSAQVTSKILYICQNALGDIITTLPSIHFLKAAYPNALLDVYVNANLADIFAVDPNVDRVIRVPAKRFDADSGPYPALDLQEAEGVREHYDVVIDSMCIASTARLVEVLRPAKAIGIGFSDAVHAYGLPLPLSHWRTWSDSERTAVECHGDLVKILNAEFKGGHPVLYVSREAHREGKAWLDSRNRAGGKVVAFNPGAGHPMKRWPMRYFLEAARALHAQGFVVLFIFGPKGAELYADHAQQIEKMGGLVYRSDTYQIQPLAGLLRQCALLLTNDCAVMHVGGAIGTRVLGIFGPTNSRIWFPYRTPWNRVMERELACRRSCRDGCKAMSCLTAIKPSNVLSEAARMLPPRGQAPPVA